MLLEDAHWIDPTSLELFDLIIERIRRLPVLLVATARPEFPSAWDRHPNVTTVALDRLDTPQSMALIARIAGDRFLPGPVLDRIVARADGVPLFLEELTKAVLESGLLDDEGDRSHRPPLAIPTTLQDSLLARLDRLAPVKEVAQIAAAIGREFPRDLLAAVARLDEPALDHALARLAEAELIFHRGMPPDRIYVLQARAGAGRGLRQPAARPPPAHPRPDCRRPGGATGRLPAGADGAPSDRGRRGRPVGGVLGAGGAASGVACGEQGGSGALPAGADAAAVAPDTVERQRREAELQSALGAARLTSRGLASEPSWRGLCAGARPWPARPATARIPVHRRMESLARLLREPRGVSAAEFLGEPT